MGWWFQRERGPGTSWYQASAWTHAGQEEGGLQDAFSICGASLRRGFFLTLPRRGKPGGGISKLFSPGYPSYA